MLRHLFFTAILSVSLLFTGCDSVTNADVETQRNQIDQVELNGPDNNPNSEPTITEIVVSNDNFSILKEAVVFAGLADELNGKKQYTVFAPTNDAFVALLDKLGITAGELLSEDNEEFVRNILLYHVTRGERTAASVVPAQQLRMVNGDFTEINTTSGPQIGNDENGFANIVATDIQASNGVVHVIDAVLLPPVDERVQGADDDIDEN